MSHSTEEAARPVLQVVKGTPTDEELAAVLWVLAAASRPADEPQPPRPSPWSAYWRQVRLPLPPGPNSWRLSGR